MSFSRKKLPTVMNQLAKFLNQNHISLEVIIATIHRTPYKRGSCKRGLIFSFTENTLLLNNK